MKSLAALHSQLATIMEALTRAAVAEMCQLVDNSYAVFQMEISRSRKENDELRRKLALIETIVARGGGAAAAVLGAGNPEETNEEPGNVHFPSSGVVDRSPNVCNGRRSGPRLLLAPSAEAAPSAAELVSQDTSFADVSRSEEDVFPVKQEVASDKDNSGELLQDEDETVSQQAHPKAGPSGIVATTSSADFNPWEQNVNTPPQGSLSFPGSPGLARDNSSDVVYDIASESDGEISSARKSSALLSGSPDQALGLPSPRPGTGEPDRCSPWASQGLPCILALPRRPASDLNTAFPLALGLAGPRLDTVDRSRLRRDRRFVCNYCGKWFSSARSLETHVRVHTGERPYCCGQCGKRFTQSGHLKTHQSVHTGERPFACHRCAKRFAGKQNLRIHLQKHHPGAQQEG
ncbi:zinc finger protein SNAI1 isoform X2 [Hippocampus comes]|uniref:zinc finger protein SNAI1 isoform X2 n=1 Tax=Hippocampus comes TaxID=109280 RepID=UPI00094ED1DB|nr:PREDICTED: zinc finger protein SNAI1-like isoform X2 [Hippocampus comes]